MANEELTVGNYKLVNCLASGQHSQVWEVTDGSPRRIAMKLLLPEALKEAELVSTLKHEFKTGSTFDHPNIIKYYEISTKKTHAYFTMELFSAPNLKQQIHNDVTGVQIRLKRLIELTAMALEHVHSKGWLHRDVKPDNILMNKSSEVRLVDFSLAEKAAGAFSKMLGRKTGLVQGTRTYMSPEQIQGKPLSVQADIYALGITLFECLTGEPPFKGSTPKDLLLKHIGEPAPAPSEFNSNVTPEMDQIVLKMLAKKPENRQKSMNEFMAEFRNVSIFKEEVKEKHELTEKELAEQELKASLGEKLDSRMDALRTKLGTNAPPTAGQGTKPPEKKAVSKKAPAAQPQMPQPAAPYPPPGAMPGMPMPQYPGMPMPQYPGMPYGAMPPGMPGGPLPYPPGAVAYGQQPYMMPPGMPQYGQPMPPQTMPPQVPPGIAPTVTPAPAMVPPGATAGQAAPVPPAAPSVATAPVPAPAPPGASPAATPLPRSPAPLPRTPVPPKETAPAAGKEEKGFSIADLPGFDDLPSA